MDVILFRVTKCFWSFIHIKIILSKRTNKACNLAIIQLKIYGDGTGIRREFVRYRFSYWLMLYITAIWTGCVDGAPVSPLQDTCVKYRCGVYTTREPRVARCTPHSDSHEIKIPTTNASVRGIIDLTRHTSN